jgi:hypothetical protein
MLTQSAGIAVKPPVGVPADAKFYNGKWYRVYLEKVPWNRAKERCKALGGQLVVIPDQLTWEFLKTLSEQGTVQLWLGATDEVTEGVWKWIDGTPMKFKGWRPGEPNNAGGSENYLAIYKGAWADCPNGGEVGTVFKAQGFICEWKK